MVEALDWTRVSPPSSQENAGVGREKNRMTAAAYSKPSVPEALFAQSRQPRRRRRRGAPGPTASSMSSGDILERSTLPLSPVMGPGASSFSSVASAFDFQHHVGSDPALELLVLKRILVRESLLSRLESFCSQLRKRRRKPARDAEGDRMIQEEKTDGVVKMLSSMRDATVAVVEAVALWREDMAEQPRSGFMWHDENYLLKVTNDLNFLAGVEPLAIALKIHPARFCRNPLMLPQTLDEQRRDGELHEIGLDTTSPRIKKRTRLYEIAQVILDEEGLESKRECLRREASGTAVVQPGRDTSSLEPVGSQDFQSYEERLRMERGGSSANDNIRKMASKINGTFDPYSPNESSYGTNLEQEEDNRQHQGELSTWYDEARSQLVSLSTSLADEEYFLSSRRFWSKAELEYTESCRPQSSPPPPHQHPVTLGHGKRPSFATPMESRRHLGRPDRKKRFLTAGGRQPFHDNRQGKQKQGVDHFGHGPVSYQGDMPRQARRLQGLHAGYTGRPGETGVGVHGNEDVVRGKADVWIRPEEDDRDLQSGKSSALSCLTTDDIEWLAREENPSPATTVVCATIAFLLASDDQVPEDFCWPRGFEEVALPAEKFLLRLHEFSGRIVSSFKARVLTFVLQKEEILPMVIEREGGHVVASLCAWALEVLQSSQEFTQWSQAALEPWYELQMNITRVGVPESTEGPGSGAMLVYKALHMLSGVGGSYVISLFEENNGEDGLTIRAFDRVRPESVWLSISKKQLSSFGANETRSPTHLAAALARRLKVKVDNVTGSKRLVLPPVKTAESSKKNSKSIKKQVRVGVASTVGEASTEQPFPPTQATATPDKSDQKSLQICRSHPPVTRGSITDDLGPLVESEVDNEGDSVGKAGAITGASNATDIEGLVSVSTFAVKPLKAIAGVERGTEETTPEFQANSHVIGDEDVSYINRNKETSARSVNETSAMISSEIVIESGPEMNNDRGSDLGQVGGVSETDPYTEDFVENNEDLEGDITEPKGKITGKIEPVKAEDVGADVVAESAKGSLIEEPSRVEKRHVRSSQDVHVMPSSSGDVVIRNEDAPSLPSEEGFGITGRNSDPTNEVQRPNEDRADTVTVEGISEDHDRPRGEKFQARRGTSESSAAEEEGEEDVYENEFGEEDIGQDESAGKKTAKLNEPSEISKEGGSPSQSAGITSSGDLEWGSQMQESDQNDEYNVGFPECSSFLGTGPETVQPPQQNELLHLSSAEKGKTERVVQETTLDEYDSYGIEEEFGEDSERTLQSEDFSICEQDSSASVSVKESPDQSPRLQAESVQIEVEAATTEVNNSFEKSPQEFEDTPSEDFEEDFDLEEEIEAIDSALPKEEKSEIASTHTEGDSYTDTGMEVECETLEDDISNVGIFVGDRPSDIDDGLLNDSVEGGGHSEDIQQTSEVLAQTGASDPSIQSGTGKGEANLMMGVESKTAADVVEGAMESGKLENKYPPSPADEPLGGSQFLLGGIQPKKCEELTVERTQLSNIYNPGSIAARESFESQGSTDEPTEPICSLEVHEASREENETQNNLDSKLQEEESPEKGDIQSRRSSEINDGVPENSLEGEFHTEDIQQMSEVLAQTGTPDPTVQSGSGKGEANLVMDVESKTTTDVVEGAIESGKLENNPPPTSADEHSRGSQSSVGDMYLDTCEETTLGEAEIIDIHTPGSIASITSFELQESTNDHRQPSCSLEVHEASREENAIQNNLDSKLQEEESPEKGDIQSRRSSEISDGVPEDSLEGEFHTEDIQQTSEVLAQTSTPDPTVQSGSGKGEADLVMDVESKTTTDVVEGAIESGKLENNPPPTSADEHSRGSQSSVGDMYLDTCEETTLGEAEIIDIHTPGSIASITSFELQESTNDHRQPSCSLEVHEASREENAIQNNLDSKLQEEESPEKGDIQSRRSSEISDSVPEDSLEGEFHTEDIQQTSEVLAQTGTPDPTVQSGFGKGEANLVMDVESKTTTDVVEGAIESGKLENNPPPTSADEHSRGSQSSVGDMYLDTCEETTLGEAEIIDIHTPGSIASITSFESQESTNDHRQPSCSLEVHEAPREENAIQNNLDSKLQEEESPKKGDIQSRRSSDIDDGILEDGLEGGFHDEDMQQTSEELTQTDKPDPRIQPESDNGEANLAMGVESKTTVSVVEGAIESGKFESSSRPTNENDHKGESQSSVRDIQLDACEEITAEGENMSDAHTPGLIAARTSFESQESTNDRTELMCSLGVHETRRVENAVQKNLDSRLQVEESLEKTNTSNLPAPISHGIRPSTREEMGSKEGEVPCETTPSTQTVHPLNIQTAPVGDLSINNEGEEDIEQDGGFLHSGREEKGMEEGKVVEDPIAPTGATYFLQLSPGVIDKAGVPEQKEEIQPSNFEEDGAVGVGLQEGIDSPKEVLPSSEVDSKVVVNATKKEGIEVERGEYDEMPPTGRENNGLGGFEMLGKTAVSIGVIPSLEVDSVAIGETLEKEGLEENAEKEETQPKSAQEKEPTEGEVTRDTVSPTEVTLPIIVDPLTVDKIPNEDNVKKTNGRNTGGAGDEGSRDKTTPEEAKSFPNESPIAIATATEQVECDSDFDRGSEAQPIVVDKKDSFPADVTFSLGELFIVEMNPITDSSLSDELELDKGLEAKGERELINLDGKGMEESVVTKEISTLVDETPPLEAPSTGHGGRLENIDFGEDLGTQAELKLSTSELEEVKDGKVSVDTPPLADVISSIEALPEAIAPEEKTIDYFEQEDNTQATGVKENEVNSADDLKQNVGVPGIVISDEECPAAADGVLNRVIFNNEAELEMEAQPVTTEVNDVEQAKGLGETPDSTEPAHLNEPFPASAGDATKEKYTGTLLGLKVETQLDSRGENGAEKDDVLGNKTSGADATSSLDGCSKSVCEELGGKGSQEDFEQRAETQLDNREDNKVEEDEVLGDENSLIEGTPSLGMHPVVVGIEVDETIFLGSHRAAVGNDVEEIKLGEDFKQQQEELRQTAGEARLVEDRIEDSHPQTGKEPLLIACPATVGDTSGRKEPEEDFKQKKETQPVVQEENRLNGGGLPGIAATSTTLNSSLKVAPAASNALEEDGNQHVFNEEEGSEPITNIKNERGADEYGGPGESTGQVIPSEKIHSRDIDEAPKGVQSLHETNSSGSIEKIGANERGVPGHPTSQTDADPVEEEDRVAVGDSTFEGGLNRDFEEDREFKPTSTKGDATEEAQVPVDTINPSESNTSVDTFSAQALKTSEENGSTKELSFHQGISSNTTTATVVSVPHSGTDNNVVSSGVIGENEAGRGATKGVGEEGLLPGDASQAGTISPLEKESFVVEDDNFEEDFEEDLDKNTEIPSVESNEQKSDRSKVDVGAVKGAAEGGSEVSLKVSGQQHVRGKLESETNSALPLESTSSAVSQEGLSNRDEGRRRESPRVEEHVKTPPRVDEVLNGNQAEDQTRDEIQRTPLNRSAVKTSEEFEDDFEDDFEHP